MANTSLPETSLQRHKKRIFRFKQHPFIIPVITLLILVGVALVSIVVFNATTLGPADSRVVHVFVDEQERTLPTRAKTVGELLQKLDITINEGDVVEPSVDTPIYEDDFSVNVYRSREVVIKDGKRSINADTASRSPRIIARNAGVVVYPEDNIVPEAPEDVLEGGFAEHYRINRATPVTLILYGQLLPVRTQSKTVGELLEEKNIVLSEGDNIKPTATTRLTKSTKVVITRPGQTIVTKEEAIAPPTEYIDDPDMFQGDEELREEGQPGRRVVTYDIQKKAGKEVSRKKLQEIIAFQPVPRIVARGTKVIVTDPSQNVQIGRRLAASRGWGEDQFYCLYQLWSRESGWSTTAGNPSTGAYGIPQALPGSKMASVGADWRFNPSTQISWGLGYVAGRYGNPCGAWSTFQSRGWY